MPSTCCGVISGLGVRYAERPLPEHSMKCVRVTDGKAFEIREGELDRTIDEPVDEQRVLRRIDRRSAGVDACEVQIRRRDRARQRVQRRERRARDFADRCALPARRRAIVCRRRSSERRALSLDRRAQRAVVRWRELLLPAARPPREDR